MLESLRATVFDTFRLLHYTWVSLSSYTSLSVFQAASIAFLGGPLSAKKLEISTETSGV